MVIPLLIHLKDRKCLFQIVNRFRNPAVFQLGCRQVRVSDSNLNPRFLVKGCHAKSPFQTVTCTVKISHFLKKQTHIVIQAGIAKV